ncbi:MFS transporter [Streptomyces liangshanensis]|uniref:MFS transporter n=1 Tax=Streptomyces liangshanensis TaxID=2717324 RepID=A0A6G9H5Y9_9ACTN|nr:MFS transporter [Streptomyces liangshanensis]QIQ05968.1 MFS transporter [Streptomyces liangshanensis]
MTANLVQQRADRRAWLGLTIVLCLVALVAMDGSVLYLAMPSITSAITPSTDQALWILDIYGFVVASFLITFGTVGDRYGRLRLLVIGSIVFGVGSVGAAFSTTPEMLIAFRALMGLGGATLLPSGLAIISNLFHDAKQRAQAIGIFAATFAAGFVVGPILGGVLLNHYSWGSVFLINIPIVVLFLAFAPVLLREVRTSNPGRVDALSVALSSVGILLAVYSVKSAAAHGFSLTQAVTGVLGIATLWWFVSRQRTLEYPLVDFKLFHDRVFTIAILTGTVTLVAWSAASYLTGVYLQSVLGYGILTAAMAALPGAFVLTGACIGANVVVERVGKKTAFVASLFFMAVGLLILLLTSVTGGVWVFIASTVVASVGYGFSFSLVAETAVAAVPMERAGSAGALAEMSNELGNALGISLLGSLAAVCFRLLGPDVAGTLDETLDTPGLAAGTIADAEQAFVTGMHVAIGVASLILFTLGFLALRWLPRSAPEEARETEGAEAV